ncbi:helix-turn-helix domain-containing protein [Macrococcoides bohemicum]|uniref:helix-turn-helix domain-containing protein n=1 Tax=Macrococcoides bohemicum TaxID=1903056 RepID=UPI00105A5D71|nr:helix-turn-helix domain-containing protein [Macrococcus bohemicus]TDL40580.1 helix-turn-helix domain-containing protein [Macrococcus bohemicus]
MKEQPSYYAIITANVRYDNRLTDSEKLLFAEITALSNKYGYCSASNGYFAELYDVTKVTISRRINRLKEYGYLNVDFVYNGREIKSRKLYPITNASIPINNSVNTPLINSDNSPINRNDKENITSINNTRLNNTSNNSATEVADINITRQFDEWWNLYNKKVDRKKSEDKFKKCVKRDGFEKIMDGTRKYLATIKDKQYQKHPTTFLNGENYNDEYEVIKAQPNNPYANLY